MRLLVFGDPLRLDADHHAHALHSLPPIVWVNSATLFALTLSRSHSTPIPGAEGASAIPVLDPEARGRQVVKLRNVLDIFPVRDGAYEARMQLHQKMRADRHVEGFRGMRDLQPGRDSADAGDVDLHDRAGAPLHVVAEMPDRVERFADRDRRRGRLAKPDMAVEVVGRQRLLDPCEVEVGEAPRAADRLVEREALIGVGHDLVVGADRRAHRGEPRIVLDACGRPILTFEPQKPLLRAQRARRRPAPARRCAASRPRSCRAACGRRRRPRRSTAAGRDVCSEGPRAPCRSRRARAPRSRRWSSRGWRIRARARSPRSVPRPCRSAAERDGRREAA